MSQPRTSVRSLFTRFTIIASLATCLSGFLGAIPFAPVAVAASQAPVTGSYLFSPALLTTTQASVAAAAPHPGAYYLVHSGDYLSAISKRAYGTYRCWPGIYRKNARIIGSSPDLIKVGQRLLIPAKCDAKPLAVMAKKAVKSPASAPLPPSTPPAQLAAASGSPQAAAQAVFGSQYSCAAYIITRESGWNTYARNPSSGAYGLPQALPGSKMASAGADWATNPLTQLRWMKSYVDSSYGGACAAMSFWQGHGWY